jgi:protein-disulfide isomerase
MDDGEERPDAGVEEERRPEGTTRPPKPAETQAQPAETQTEPAEAQTQAEPAEAQTEPAETKTREIETQAVAAAEDRQTRPRRRILTAVLSIALLVPAGVALFVAGFFTHSLLDDDPDLVPVEDRLTALEGQGNTIDGRIAEIEDILSGAVANSGAAQPTANPLAATSAASNDDPSFGPEDADVVIVAFSDFQCPYCQRFVDETLPSIQEAYGDRVRFIFRDYPLGAIHQYAQKAAEAGQCAQEQGLFWEYHDLLFANQATLTVPDLKNFAAQVGADTAAFNDCLDSGKYTDEVVLDIKDGQAAGITGTPGFIMNGVLVKGAQPFSVFQQVIDQLLAQ